MATWPAGLRKMSKMAAGGAGMGRVTSMRSEKEDGIGHVGLLVDVRASLKLPDNHIQTTGRRRNWKCLDGFGAPEPGFEAEY